MQDGLVKSNMEKLTFYASSQPEKLDRIGDYLVQKVSLNIYRNRIGFVEIAMEAMDILLASCTPQTLNLFVESYLKIIQLLLETSDPQMQLWATQSVRIQIILTLFFLNSFLIYQNFLSSQNLPTFKKIHHPTTVVMIFSCQNFPPSPMITIRIM